MDTLSVAQTKSMLSQQLRNIDDNPIRITKNGKPIAVIVSDVRFQEMERIENMLYVKMAEMASEEGFLSVDESEKILDDIASS
jgi:antitoxin Phd